VDGDVNGNGSNPTTVGPREAALFEQVRREPDRLAVAEFLGRVPPADRDGWVGRLGMWLQGEEFPPGLAPSVTEITTGLRDYRGEFNPIHVRSFVLRIVKQRDRHDRGPAPRAGGAQARLEANRRAGEAFVKGAPHA